MRKLKKVFFIAFSLVFVLVSFSVFASVDNYKKSYAGDYAEVLSEETKNYIIKNSEVLQEKTKAQIAVVTIKSLQGEEIEDYSLKLFRNWQLGDKDLKNGVLILLSVEDRKARIDVGDGLEGRINDSKAGRLLDQCSIPYFKEDKWDIGIKTLYSAILKEVYQEYDIEDIPQEVQNTIDENAIEDTQDDGIYMLIVIIAIIAIVIFAVIFSSKNNDGGQGTYGGGTGFFGGGFGDSSSSDGGFFGGGGTASGGGASRGF